MVQRKVEHHHQILGELLQEEDTIEALYGFLIGVIEDDAVCNLRFTPVNFAKPHSQHFVEVELPTKPPSFGYVRYLPLRWPHLEDHLLQLLFKEIEPPVVKDAPLVVKEVRAFHFPQALPYHKLEAFLLQRLR